VGRTNIQIVYYFDHGYLEEEKSMIHSFTVTFGEKYLTGMVTTTLKIISRKFLGVSLIWTFFSHVGAIFF
jgi:hypothetical protein